MASKLKTVAVVGAGVTAAVIGYRLYQSHSASASTATSATAIPQGSMVANPTVVGTVPRPQKRSWLHAQGQPLHLVNT